MKKLRLNISAFFIALFKQSPLHDLIYLLLITNLYDILNIRIIIILLFLELLDLLSYTKIKSDIRRTLTMTKNTASKDQLINTAMQLFREHDFESISITDICKAADVTRNTFYNNFQNKTELLVEYFQNSLISHGEIFSQLIALPNDWEKMWYLFETFIYQTINLGLPLARQLLKSHIDGQVNLAAPCTITADWCIPLIRNCQHQGIVRNKLEPEYLDFICTNICLSLSMAWCHTGGDLDVLKETRKSIVSILDISPEYL